MESLGEKGHCGIPVYSRSQTRHTAEYWELLNALNRNRLGLAVRGREVQQHCGFAGRMVLHFMADARDLNSLHSDATEILHLRSPGTHRTSSPAQVPVAQLFRLCRKVVEKTEVFFQFWLLGAVVPPCWGRSRGRAQPGHPHITQWYRYLIPVFGKEAVVAVRNIQLLEYSIPIVGNSIKIRTWHVCGECR